MTYACRWSNKFTVVETERWGGVKGEFCKAPKRSHSHIHHAHSEQSFV